MTKKRYLYLVSYFHKNGNGSSQIVRKSKINSFADLDDVKNFIETINDLENVAIINFQLISKIRRKEGTGNATERKADEERRKNNV